MLDIQDIYTKLENIEQRMSRIYSKWMTVIEAAEYCRISESRARKLIAAGTIQIHRIGGKILLNRRELDYLILFGTDTPTKRQRERAEAIL